MISPHCFLPLEERQILSIPTRLGEIGRGIRFRRARDYLQRAIPCGEEHYRPTMLTKKPLEINESPQFDFNP